MKNAAPIDGGGEMGALIRARDWSATDVGPMAFWPNALLTVLRILLSSRYAMWLAWGPDLTFFCNDAYRPTLGDKSGWALGTPAKQVWAEIWPDIGPRIDRVLRTGEATWDNGLLLFLQRKGYSEETYHTFSYSPAPDDRGAVGGMLCVVAEETERVLGERRLATLVALATSLAGADNEPNLWRAAEQALATNPRDLPFTLAFLTHTDPAGLRLVASTGVNPAAERRHRLADASLWPSLQDMAAGPVLISGPAGLAAAFDGAIPNGPAWATPPQQALALPIVWQGLDQPVGFLLVGINPFRPLDDAYTDFLRLAAGQIAASLASLRNLEEQRGRAEALAEADRVKTAFFSNVSHEFRTPLTLMLAPLEDALADQTDGDLSSAQRGRLETAHRNSLRLLKLVNTLLDFSRIEAGRLQAVYQPTDLGALTADIASGFRSAMERVGLFFDVRCDRVADRAADAALPVRVYVDHDMWEKIILNLLSNALKFTFQGGVRVRFRVQGGSAITTVSDTGVGIPEPEISRLFERFHRIEGQQSRSFEGSGIGLALSAELVKLHHGTISAESTPGTGTTFKVILPLGSAHLPREQIKQGSEQNGISRRAEAYVEEALRWVPNRMDSTDLDPVIEAVEDAPGPARPRVLLADDNADMRDYVANLLKQRYAVTSVADGMAALREIRRAPPDLVLSDVMMPGLDGFELLRAIRADPALRPLPVVLLSARAGEEARAEGLDFGADDYLSKPFSARELLARVNSNIAMAQLRHQVGDALRRRTAELETVMATVPVAVWFTSDPQGDGIQANDAARKLLRVSDTMQAARALGRRGAHAHLMRAGRKLGPAEFPLQRALRGETVLDDAPELRFDNGDTVALLAQARPIRSDDGEIVGAVCTAIDVSELKTIENALRDLNAELELRVTDRTHRLLEANERLRAEMAERARVEDDLRQSQKMEAVGQLTGGLAHDFNNLLTGIIGSLELLQNRVAQGRIQDLGRYIAAARGAADRAAALTHRLLAFSRRQTLEPKVVNTNRLVAGMEELVRRTIGPAITLESVKAGGLWTTLCDPNQLENVLLNLCINARDAMPDGGRLTIETQNTSLDVSSARQRDVDPGQYVGIYVTDNGVGMPPEIVARAFDPFFTTKPTGMGTGLGLSMTYGFARQSGGQVRIYSEVGRGTSVKLYLPRHHGAETEESEVSTVAGADLSAREGETVLVVDDEPTVRMLVTEVLAELGYNAIEAEAGPAGLRIIQSPCRIDLLVTDVGLPGGMNGRQLADAARVVRPDLKVLFITGYAENAAFGNGLLEPGMQVIAKPFAMEVLATRIRGMIARSSDLYRGDEK